MKGDKKLKRFIAKLAGSLAIVGVMALGMGQAAGAQGMKQATDPATVFLAFEKVAFGTGQDIDAALGMMPDDAVLTIAPPPPGTSGTWNGKAEIRTALELAKQQNVIRVLTGSPQVDGSKVSAPATITNKVFDMWGVGEVQFSTTAVIENGMVKSYASIIAPSEQARVGAAAKAYQAAHPAQPSADPAVLLAGFEKAAFGNTQDIDAALALMSDDAVLTVAPAPPGTPGVWTGKAQIRQALLYNKQHGVKRDNVGSPVVDGNKATTMSMVTNDFFLLWEVAPVEHSTVVVAENGKIKTYTSTMSPSEQARVGAAAKAYQAAQATQQGQANLGMPNTGESDLTVIVAVLLLAAGLLLTLGLTIRRANSRS